MSEITFRQPDGQTQECQIESGISLMELAVKNNVDGIIAECGGAAACATCHVYLGAGWQGKLPAISPTETDMLEFAVGVRPESRLSCQIPVSDTMAGLTVDVPESQF